MTVQHGVPFSVFEMRQRLLGAFTSEIEKEYGFTTDEDEVRLCALFQGDVCTFIDNMHQLRKFGDYLDRVWTMEDLDRVWTVEKYVEAKMMVENSFKELISFSKKCVGWNIIKESQSINRTRVVYDYFLQCDSEEQAVFQVFCLWILYEVYGLEQIEGDVKNTLRVEQAADKVVAFVRKSQPSESNENHFYVKAQVKDSYLEIGFKRSKEFTTDLQQDTTGSNQYLNDDFFHVDVKIVRSGIPKKKTIRCSLFGVWYKLSDIFSADSHSAHIEEKIELLQSQAYDMSEDEWGFAVAFNISAEGLLDEEKKQSEIDKSKEQFKEFEQELEKKIRNKRQGSKPTGVEIGASAVQAIGVTKNMEVEKPSTPSTPSSPQAVYEIELAVEKTVEEYHFEEWIELRRSVFLIEFWKRVLARYRLKGVQRVKRLASAEVVKALKFKEDGFKRNSEYDAGIALVYNLVAGIQKKY